MTPNATRQRSGLFFRLKPHEIEEFKRLAALIAGGAEITDVSVFRTMLREALKKREKKTAKNLS